VAKSFRCQIVTPAEEVFDGEVNYVDLPAWDGQMGVMAARSAMLVELGCGPLRIETPDGASRTYVLRDGFAQMDNDRLTLLTESAEPAESINVAEAERSLASIRSELANSPDGRPRSAESIAGIAKRQQLELQRIAAGRAAGR
jgi:F-type H+-transporting ATPase subunit epsilon